MRQNVLMQFRQVDREDAVVPSTQLWNLDYPDLLRSEEESRAYMLHFPPGTFEQVWLGELNGNVVAIIDFMDHHGNNPPKHLEFDVLLDPQLDESHWPLSVDKAIQFGKDHAAEDVSIWINGRRTNRAQHLLSKGLALCQSVPVTRLHLSDFDPQPFQDRLASVEQLGIRITNATELEKTEMDWVKGLYDASIEMLDDMPHDHPPSHITLEQFRDAIKNKIIYNFDLMFLAVHDERIVGYSRVTPSAAMPELVNTGLSGVVRDFRRKGVVTALKVRGIQSLQQQNYKWVQTDNDERNPMYQLNLALGYKRIWDWERYKIIL